MKSAYELAMERLNKSAPTTKLNAEQKARLAELDLKYAAKIAEREITLSGEIARATAAGEEENAAKARQRLADDRRSIQSELESKKELVRHSKT